jgi:hypothetical protein
VAALQAGLVQGAPLEAAVETRIRSLARRDRPQHPADWLRARVDSLVQAAREPAHGEPWGWKEPNTHLVIERLWQRLPRLRYVHVVRNGVDMAYSRNQNQLRLWGAHVLGEDGPIAPGRSLAYWCAVHRRMQRLLAKDPHRMYWLDYDALCQQPRIETGKFFAFLGLDVPRDSALLQQVRAPSRRKGIDEREFAPADLEYARLLRFDLHA